MKKYLSIILAMLFVLGFAASAFAIHADIPSDTTAAVAADGTQITLSGEIRVRYDWRHVSFVSDANETSFLNERIRLGLEAKVSPNTTGMIQLSSYNGGGSADSDNLIVGTGGNNTGSVSQATGFFKNGNEFKGFMTIRQMWIMNQGTGLLGVNSGVKVGHMPIIVGTGLFLDHSYFGDDALVAFVNPVKELELDAVAIKFAESQTTANSTVPSSAGDVFLPANGGASETLANESNAYVFIANYKPDKTTGVSFDATYVDDQNLGYVENGPGLYPDIHLWNFGIRGNTEVEGFRFMVDGEIQAGQEVSNTTKPNVDFQGYAAKGGVGYTLDPVKLDLEFGYGSGDNGKDNTKVKTFITTQGPESTFGDPYRSMGMQGPYVYNYRTVNAANNTYGGLENMWYLRLGGNGDLAKDWNLDIAVYYLQAVEASATTLYNVYGFTGKNITATGVANGGLAPNHDIGTEVDYRLTYKIDKGLQTWVEGGYLWAGDFWRAVSTVPLGANPTDAYTTRVGIQLNF